MKYIKLFENFKEQDIHDICREYEIKNYTINDNGSIDVNGDVYLSNKDLTKLPPIKFRNVTGGFYCQSNKLTSLEGCPESVGGYFYCSYNQLTTLEGGPEYVDQDFDCSNNQLTSLEGCPESVGGGFYCVYNRLISLEGCSESVGSYFNCSYNQLTSLKGGTKSVGGGFYCNNNQLISLEGCSESVGGYFNCSYNQLTSLKGGPKSIGENFNCGNNNIKDFKYFVEPNDNFYCIDNPIYEIWKLFKDKSYIELLNDYDCIRDNNIILYKLNDFLENIGNRNYPVKSISGYNTI